MLALAVCPVLYSKNESINFIREWKLRNVEGRNVKFPRVLGTGEFFCCSQRFWNVSG